MNRFKKQIALFLLAVFSLAVLPAPALHELFADHTDAADNHCRFYHKDLGRHIEEGQTHCDIFKTNSPIYEGTKVHLDFKLYNVVDCQFVSGAINSVSFSPAPTLPARAPPAA